MKVGFGMDDARTTIDYLKKQVKQAFDERDWNQFHSPKNLSMDIAVEASELMEKFLWIEGAASFDELKTNRQEVEDEFADILIALCAFANQCDIDIVSAFNAKLAELKAKYPVEKAKGRAVKYTKL